MRALPQRFYGLLLLIPMALLAGCYYDVEEELYPEGACNTTQVSYSEVVRPVLENSCLSCHSQGLGLGGVVLETHQDVVTHVNNGRLLGAIQRAPGFAPMPQNQPQLPDCTIERIEAWVEQGALDN